MNPTRHAPEQKIDAAFARAAKLLQRNKNFADAYYLGRAHLERGAKSEGKLTGFIWSAYESGLLDECAEFLVALCDERPDDAELLNYTAGLLGEMGQRQQSRALAKKSAARKPFFPSRVKNAKMHVLALQCIATADYRYAPTAGRFFLPGLTNLYTLLDPGIAVHRLLVDDLPAALEAVKSLPQCDLIFNTISDPDYEEALQNAQAICDALKRPAFNPPHHVREMNRAALPPLVQGKSARLTAAKSLYLPPERAKNGDIAAAMQENRLPFPVIIRAPGFQGGRQMRLVAADIEELGEELYRGDGLYVIEFIDVSFRDGRAPGALFYPKYRAFFVDGRLFPMHLFVSDQFEVHRKTSDPIQAGNPWLLDMEREFLHAPERHLPEGLWDELKRATSTFGLDYFGMDFAVSTRAEDFGKLVLFECNAAMRNRMPSLPEGDLVQRHWRDVTLAAHTALCEKSGVAAWPFVLKKGLIFTPLKQS